MIQIIVLDKKEFNQNDCDVFGNGIGEAPDGCDDEEFNRCCCSLLKLEIKNFWFF